MDEWQGNIRNPITMKNYLYANNEPVNATDPSGYVTLTQAIQSLSRAKDIAVARASTVGASAVKAGIKIVVAVGGAGTKFVRRELVRCRKSDGEKCRLPNAVVIGSDYLSAQQHISDTILGEGSNGKYTFPILTYLEGGNKDRRWLVEDGTPCERNVKGQSCDEFPFAATKQGGEKKYNQGKVSLRMIDHAHNRDSGLVYARASRALKKIKNKKFLVIPAGPKSFSFIGGEFRK